MIKLGIQPILNKMLKKKTKIFAATLLILGYLFISNIGYVWAQVDTSNTVSNGTTNTQKIQNPFKYGSTIQCFVSEVLKFIVDILAVVAVLYIMYAGFQFVLARGNPDAISDAKRSLLYALVGTGILLGAWVFATVIATTINQITGANINFNQNSCSSS
jgi:hypothetical protein